MKKCKLIVYISSALLNQQSAKNGLYLFTSDFFHGNSIFYH